MLYYGHVLVAMVPFDVPWSVVYAITYAKTKFTLLVLIVTLVGLSQF